MLRSVLKRKTREGRLNAIIDALCHPKFPDPLYLALDTCLHYLVERDDPERFWRKFVKYNLKYFLPRREKRLSEKDLDRIALMLVIHELSKGKGNEFE